jgi:arylsulfatase A-like enzyme
MYVALTSPHTPVLPRNEFQGTSKAGAYGDFVQETDWSIGQISKALKEKGIQMIPHVLLHGLQL